MRNVMKEQINNPNSDGEKEIKWTEIEQCLDIEFPDGGTFHCGDVTSIAYIKDTHLIVNGREADGGDYTLYWKDDEFKSFKLFQEEVEHEL